MIADRTRRVVAAVLTTVALLVAPEVAAAAFRSGASVAQEVGTASLSQPAGLTGTYSCDSRLLSTDRARATVTGFAAQNPSGTTYRYELLNGSRVVAATSTTAPATATAPVGLEGARIDTSRTWTLRVRAVLRSFTTAWVERSFTCRELVAGEGAL